MGAKELIYNLKLMFFTERIYMSQIFSEALNIFSIVIAIAGILIGIIVARHYFNKSQKMLTRSKKAPDYYWKVVNPGALYFPWGKPE